MRLQLDDVLRLSGLNGPGQQLTVVYDLHDGKGVGLRSGRLELRRGALQAGRRGVRRLRVAGTRVGVGGRHASDDLRLLDQVQVVRADHCAIRVDILVLVHHDLVGLGAVEIHVFRRLTHFGALLLGV